MSSSDQAANRRKFLQFLAGSPLLAAGGFSAFAGEGPTPGNRLPDPLMWAPMRSEDLIASPKQAINVFDFEPVCRQNVPPAHFGYMASGIDDEVTLRANREGFLKFQLRPRRLVDVSKVDMSTDILGTLLLTRSLSLDMLGAVVAILFLVAAADYLFQYRQWYERQKMSLREMKDEFKQTEGDPAIKALKDTDKDQHDKICGDLRTDGSYADTADNYNLIVQKLEANPKAVGIFGYSYLESNADKLQGLTMGGIAPTYETIANFTYPGARPLFIYVKKAHVGAIPGLKEYVAQWAKLWGTGGPLAKAGMIAMPADLQEKSAKAAAELTTLDSSTLK